MEDEFIIPCSDGFIVDPVFKPNAAIKGLQEIVSPFLLPIFFRPHHYPHHKNSCNLIGGAIQGKLFCAGTQN